MFRMSRADRRLWAEATTLADLGELMALWLEGQIKYRPGYYQPAKGADSETQALVPTLAILNRAGFVTDNSQPGEIGPGFDGLIWRQKTWVEGYIDDQRLLDRLARAARSAGAEVLVDSTRCVVVTTRGGEPHTSAGGRVPRSYFRRSWGEVGRDAYDALRSAHRVAIAARDFGEAGERLWPALARAAQGVRR